MTKPIVNKIHKRKIGDFYEIIPIKFLTRRHAEIQAELCVKFDSYSRCYDVYLHSDPLKFDRTFFGDAVISRTKGQKIFRHVLRTRDRDAEHILAEVCGQFVPGTVVAGTV